jgi:hypothetical protein
MNKTKREQIEARWFEVLEKRRQGMKWKELAEHYKCDPSSLNRMAMRAIDIERERQGLPAIQKFKGKRTRVFVICENPRFYCLDKVYWDGVSRMECECGNEQFPIHSERGKHLKTKRESCRTAFSLGDTRKMDRPALCSKFADAVILDPISTKKFAI